MRARKKENEFCSAFKNSPMKPKRLRRSHGSGLFSKVKVEKESDKNIHSFFKRGLIMVAFKNF